MLVCASVQGSEHISDEQALKIANKAISKFDVHSPQWVAHLDKTLKAWTLKRHSWEEYLASTKETWPRKRIEKIDAALKGKEVWLVAYNRLVSPGIKVFHTNVIVFLDAQTGAVLEIINPEE
jgi:hypothetical protein